MADLSNLSNDELLAIVHEAAASPTPTKSADSNLGGTLQLGIPFTGKRYDTGIPLPASLEAGIVSAGKTTQRLLQGVNPFTNKADVEEENRLYQPLKDAHPIATTAGEIAPYLAATSIPAMMAMSAAEYGTPMERAERAAFAAAGGLVGKGVGRLFGPKSMAPIASNGAEDFVDTALSAGNKWGIPLRMAQTTDSKPVQIVDAVAQNLPVVGNVINKAKDASYQGFNRAVSNTFGEDATKITPELLGAAKQRAGSAIGNIAERNTLQATQDLGDAMLAIRSRVQNELTGDDAALVMRQWDAIRKSIDPNTLTMSGPKYKAFDSLLGKMAKNNKGTVSDVLGDMRTALRDAMDSSISKEDAAAWMKARHDYFNVQQVANASKSTPGELSPTQLLAAVNNAQRNARFGAGNDLAELAQWAKPVLGDKIPNSGTAQRTLYQKFLTNPVTSIGAVGGAGYGMNEMGVNPADAIGGGLLAYILSRGMAGKPASEFTRRLLTEAGGLGGLAVAPK